LDHPHAFGQIEGLLNQGCQLVGLSPDDPAASVAQSVRHRWADASWMDDSTSLLHDPSIQAVARSGRLAIRAQESATMTRFAK